MWATIVKERYGAKDDRSCMFRFGVVCGGSTLHAQHAQIEPGREHAVDWKP